MKSTENSRYEFIPFEHLNGQSDSEMILSSENHFLKMKSRRTIRDFSERSVPFSVIENCIKVACSAPSGANQQPWHFSIVSDPIIKSHIRDAAEREERKFYNNDRNTKWLKTLEPLGTDINKPHLELAPWLIIVFAERYGQMSNREYQKNYYVPESVGIATGFLISALHLAGLSCLTHTPNPMGFLRTICQRPKSNKAILILAVGHPAEGTKIPFAATVKKKLSEVISIF
tara:strand:+ start:196 stop:885 length:690 start_codon:yes stop_codon:yes gene_type:complete